MITTSQTLFDGYRKTVMRFTGIGQDTVQENAVTKVDISKLNPKPKRMRVDRLYGTTGAGAVKVTFDGSAPSTFALVDGIYDLDFTDLGGFTESGGETDDPSLRAGLNGNIAFTTLGFDVNSTYDITIIMVKRFR